MRRLLPALLLIVPSAVWAKRDDWSRDLKAIEIRAKAVEPYMPHFDGHGAFIRGSEQVATFSLTFDDGPGEVTPAILEVLARHGAKATFFMVGEQVKERPITARMVAQAGHEIGNHTYHHIKVCDPDRQLANPRSLLMHEIEKADKAIEDAVGIKPVFVRMPYACRAAWAENAIAASGRTVARWSVDGEDWRGRLPARTARYYIDHLRPGAVLLLHDAGGKSRKRTVKVLEQILAAADKLGLKSVTMSDLMKTAPRTSNSSAR